MSEKIFACLLRLYPARFRKHYGAESIGLLRARMQDEPGIAGRFRLWFDLLFDLAAGLPQAYRNSYAMVAASPVPHTATGLPAFRTLDEEPLRPESVVLGSVLAFAALAAFVFVMNHASAYHPLASLRGLAHRSVTQSDAEQAAEKIEEKARMVNALQSCGFEKLELHPGNIGYVKLNFFADPARCGEMADAVMERLNDTDAIIFDLRDNRGGFPAMVQDMADWLFDHPVPWYNPRATSPQESVTHSPVPGSRLANKPVFILTSRRTFSGGEHFTYDLKTLKRATVVGETTSGASHGNGPPPEGTIPVWEGSGVAPDVKVSEAEALGTAEERARSALGKH